MAQTTTPRTRFVSLPERTKLLIMSLAVGIGSGFAAVVLEKLIDWIRSLVQSVGGGSYHWQYLIFPGIGMLLSLLALRYLIKDDISHGVTKALVAVSKNDSRIKPHNMWSSVLTSALTIGFGGSVGAEAPIVYTGAAIGSNVARACKLSYRNMTVLLGCGAAGAIAGIFKAPMAGVLFVMEILLFNISMSSLLPILISTVSATVVSTLLLGGSHPFRCAITPFSMGNIPFYIILGVFCGLFSIYFLRTTLKMEDRLASYKNRYLKWLVCSVGLGLLIFLFPHLYGEGYDSLQQLLTGEPIDLDAQTPLSFFFSKSWGIPLFFLCVMLLKVVSMTLTNAGGGVGGTFGPTLFVGALGGFVIARCINLALVNAGISVPEQNFVLAGMAGLMAGVMQAPMTAIFLIAEATGGYELFLPLIIVATISFGTSRIFEHYSIYTKRIAQSGELLTHDSDRTVLTLLHTSDLIRDKYPRVHMEQTLREVLPVLSENAVAVYPVVDDKDRFQGLLDIDVMRKYLLRTDLYDTMHVYNLMQQPPVFVYDDEDVSSVMDKFDRTEAWRLPVVTRDHRYLGFISKSRILMAYRDELKAISTED